MPVWLCQAWLVLGVCRWTFSGCATWTRSCRCAGWTWTSPSRSNWTSRPTPRSSTLESCSTLARSRASRTIWPGGALQHCYTLMYNAPWHRCGVSRPLGNTTKMSNKTMVTSKPDMSTTLTLDYHKHLEAGDITSWESFWVGLWRDKLEHTSRALNVGQVGTGQAWWHRCCSAGCCVQLWWCSWAGGLAYIRARGGGAWLVFTTKRSVGAHEEICIMEVPYWQPFNTTGHCILFPFLIELLFKSTKALFHNDSFLCFHLSLLSFVFCTPESVPDLHMLVWFSEGVLWGRVFTFHWLLILTLRALARMIHIPLWHLMG